MKRVLFFLFLLLAVTSRAALQSNPFTTNGPAATNGIIAGGALTFGVTNGGAGELTNLYFHISALGSGKFILTFDGGAPGDQQYGTVFYNTTHDGPVSPDNSELQLSLSHNLALIPGYRGVGIGSGHIQIGIESVDAAHTNGGIYMFLQSQPAPGMTNGHSAALVGKAAAYDGNGNMLSAHYPGWVVQVTSTNEPKWELDGFPDLNNTGGLSTGPFDGRWNSTTLLTNGIRLTWNGTSKEVALIDGYLAISNDFTAVNITANNTLTTVGGAQFVHTGGGTTLEALGANVIVGDTVNATFTIKDFAGNVWFQSGGLVFSNWFGQVPLVSAAGWAGSAFTTNRIAIAATGYTNTFQIANENCDVDVYFKAATATLQDSAGTTLHSYTTTTTQDTYAHMKPGWRLVGTTMTGDAIAH